jgi:predicted membrane protein
VSSRLRDVLPLTVGAYAVALGALFLLDSLGIRRIGNAGLAEGAFALLLIALGVLAVLASLRVRRFRRRLRRAIGHVRSAEGWSVNDGVIQTVLGDIRLDLRDAQLPEGETNLTLLCWLGTIEVRAPAGVGLDATAQAIAGTVDVLDQREQGLIRDIHVRTPDFDAASRRLNLRLSTVIGELVVRQERPR